MNTLLFFTTSNNCDPCRLLARNICEAYLPIPITTIDVSVSQSQQTLYNVTQLPTMILLDDNGVEIKRTLGNKPVGYIQIWTNTN